MKIQGGSTRFIQTEYNRHQVHKNTKQPLRQIDTFTKSLENQISYMYDTKHMASSKGENRKVVGLTEEQFEQMLSGELGEVETDGDNYWMVVEGILYEFKKISKEDEEKQKGTYDMLLDTVEVCLERAQERLDEKFYKWTMREDILYPNQGKNAMITLEDILNKKEELDEEKRRGFNKERGE